MLILKNILKWVVGALLCFPGLVIPDKRIENKEDLFFVIFWHDGSHPDFTKCHRTELASSSKIIQFGIGLSRKVVQRDIEYVSKLRGYFHLGCYLSSFVLAYEVTRCPTFLPRSPCESFLAFLNVISLYSKSYLVSFKTLSSALIQIKRK